MKRVMNIVFLAGITAYLLLAMSFVSNREKMLHVTAMRIRIAIGCLEERCM